jgi:hypothetical protein
MILEKLYKLIFLAKKNKTLTGSYFKGTKVSKSYEKIEPVKFNEAFAVL